MTAPLLPPEIAITETPDGVHYRLPKPRFPLLRFGGGILVFFGCVPIGMGFVFISFMVTAGFLNAPFPFVIFPLLFLLFPLGVMVAGLAMIWFGLLLLFGHSEIDLGTNYIKGTMRAGPLHFSRRRTRNLLNQFTVVAARQSRSPLSGAGSSPISLYTLQAECKNSRPLPLAFGHPHELLVALANELSLRCQHVPTELLAAGQVQTVPVAEESSDPADIREREQQPINSTAILEDKPDGLTLIVPPTGIWHGTNKFLVIWTIGWCGMMGFISVMFGLVAFAGGWQQGNAAAGLWPLLMLVPFWVVGVGLLLGVIHRGRRSTVLAVVGDRLMLLQAGPFRSRRQEWSREELNHLRVVSKSFTDSEGSERWRTYLQIKPKATELFACDGSGDYQKKAELEWMATVLRRALHLRATSE